MRRGHSVIILPALLFSSFLVWPSSAAEVSFAQLRALAIESLRGGDLFYTPPATKVVGRLLWIKDAGPFADDPSGATLDYWLADDPGAPGLKAVFLDQLAIEIRRQYLVPRSRSQQVIEPYYRRMEAIVVAELALVQQPGDDAGKQRRLSDYLQQLGDILQSGADACARDMGLAGAFLEPGHDDGGGWLDRVFLLYLPQQGLPPQGQIGFGQLKAAIAQAVRDGVNFDMPQAAVEGDVLRVADVGLRVETLRSLSPLEELAAELLKLEVRRRHLFGRPENRAVMEPFYARMETALRRQLESLRRDRAATVAARRTASSSESEIASADTSSVDANRTPLGRELDVILQQGLQTCARRAGSLQLDYSRRPPGGTKPVLPQVRLLAPPDTTIELVYNTDHKLWSLAGRSQDDYPWKRHVAGETAGMLGGYWFRLTGTDGTRSNIYRKVAPNDTELRLLPR